MKFKVKRQLTAALENVPGRLAAICEAMSSHGINIEGISVVDNIEQGVTRLLTSDPAQTKKLLQELHIYVVEADVLAVEMTDHLGTLAKISATLAAENINIDYLYGSVPSLQANTLVIFKVSDLLKAQQILTDLDLN